MANKDFPHGMEPVNEGFGARPLTRVYTLTSGAEVFRGSPVSLAAAGTVDTNAAVSNSTWVGVAQHYASTAAGDTEVTVYIDPNQLYSIQADDVGTALTSAAIGAGINLLNPESGNSTTKMSTTEADTSSVATAGTEALVIVGLLDRIDNTWGYNADLIVRFQFKFHTFGTAAVV